MPVAVRRTLHRIRRAVLVRRRPLAAVLVAVSVLLALRATLGPGPDTVEVPVAAHDLAAGSRLAADDVSMARWPVELAPEGLTSSVTGQVLAAPLRRGEAITDLRVVGADLARAHPDLTVLPVRLPDPAVVELLRVGERIDLGAVDPETGTSSDLVTDALVLAIPTASRSDSSLTGRLVVLGVPPERARLVSAATLREFLTVTYSR